MAIPSEWEGPPVEWAGLPVSPTLPYRRVSKVCLMLENDTKYIEQKREKKKRENNLLCMHAVFMGTTTASHNGGGDDVSLQSDGV